MKEDLFTPVNELCTKLTTLTNEIENDPNINPDFLKCVVEAKSKLAELRKFL